MKRLALFAACMMVSNLASAASFDCGKAQTAVEKLICGNKEISRLDSELGNAYVSASCTYVSAREALVADQKKWITDVRDKCNDVECLRRAYSNRLDILTQVRTDKAEGRYVVDEDTRSSKTAEFQKELKDVGVTGMLTKCDLMVEEAIPESVQELSYGAVCNLNGRAVMICDDTMIGKLTIKFWGFAIGGDNILYFMQHNCPPGG
jgi:uncharacterized protein